MAKTTGPLFSATASGGIAGVLTFQPKMGGGSVRKMPRNNRPATPAQIEQRLRMQYPQIVVRALYAWEKDPESHYQLTLGDDAEKLEAIRLRPDRLNFWTQLLLKKEVGGIDRLIKFDQTFEANKDAIRHYLFDQTSGDQDDIIHLAPQLTTTTMGPYNLISGAIRFALHDLGLSVPAVYGLAEDSW